MNLPVWAWILLILSGGAFLLGFALLFRWFGSYFENLG